MKTVTRLVVQKRDKERVNVYLDGEFAFGLALAEALTLRIGQTLTEEQIAALQHEDGYHKARARALDQLSRRPRSRREMERFLAKHEVAPAQIERVLDRLSEVGLLDDAAFARFWIETRDTFRPRSAMAIRHELRTKGLDETIIDQALAEIGLDEVEGAYRVALKLLPRLRAIPTQRDFQQKLAGHLGRRGFSWEVIRQVAERLWEERDALD